MATLNLMKPESKEINVTVTDAISKIKGLLVADKFITSIKTIISNLRMNNIGVYLGFDLNATLNTVLPFFEETSGEMLGHVVLMIYYQEIAGGNIRLDKLEKLQGKEELKRAVAALKLQKKEGKSLGPEILTLTRLNAVFHPWGIIMRTELKLPPVADVVAPGFEGDGLFNSPDAAYVISTNSKYEKLWAYYINNWAKVHHDKVRDKKRVPLIEFNENIQNAKRAGSFVDKEYQIRQSDAWLNKIPTTIASMASLLSAIKPK